MLASPEKRLFLRTFFVEGKSLNFCSRQLRERHVSISLFLIRTDDAILQTKYLVPFS